MPTSPLGSCRWVLHGGDGDGGPIVELGDEGHVLVGVVAGVDIQVRARGKAKGREARAENEVGHGVVVDIDADGVVGHGQVERRRKRRRAGAGRAEERRGNVFEEMPSKKIGARPNVSLERY